VGQSLWSGRRQNGCRASTVLASIVSRGRRVPNATSRLHSPCPVLFTFFVKWAGTHKAIQSQPQHKFPSASSSMAVSRDFKVSTRVSAKCRALRGYTPRPMRASLPPFPISFQPSATLLIELNHNQVPRRYRRVSAGFQTACHAGVLARIRSQQGPDHNEFGAKRIPRRENPHYLRETIVCRTRLNRLA